MEILFILIGWIVAFILIRGTQFVLNQHAENKAISAATRLRELKREFDEDGSRIEFDAHYTRKLEIEQGLPARTKCDDKNCAECHWKTRMLKLSDDKDFPRGSELLKKRTEWINEQLDGLSDELYDSLYEDWLKEVESEITEHRLDAAKKSEADRRNKMEAYYATPYDKIQLYLAEGRTYLPHKGWSGVPQDKLPEIPKARYATNQNKYVIDNLADILREQTRIKNIEACQKQLAGISDAMKEAGYWGLTADYEYYLKEYNSLKKQLDYYKRKAKRNWDDNV